MKNKFVTKYIEEPIYINIINRIISSVIIFIIFTGILNSFKLQLFFYAMIVILIVFKILLMNIKRVKLDGMHCWILYLTILTLIISLYPQDNNLRVSEHLMESLISIFAISLFRVYSNDIKIIAIFTLIYISVGQLLSKGFITDHGFSFIGLLFLFYYLIIGRKLSILIFALLTIPLMTRTVMMAFVIVYLLWLIKDKIKLVYKKWILYVLPLCFIVSFLGTVFYISIYMPYDADLITFTTTRSLYYGVLVEDFINKGMAILFPSYNLYSENFISSINFSHYVNSDHRLYDYISKLNGQCPHSAYLEWLIDYGIIFGSLTVLFLVKLSNIKTIWFIFIYIITIGLICGALTPSMIVPLYVVYYLSKQLTIQIKRV